MKSKKTFLKQIMLYSLIVIFSTFFLTVSGQIITNVGKHIYTEKVLNSIKYGTDYKLFCDVKSAVSDTVINFIITRAEETEELFGLEPTTFLKEIHFIYDNEKSFFNEGKPSSVFITTIYADPDFLKLDSDLATLIILEKESHARHEICHLIDYYLSFSKEKAIINFMNKIKKTKIENKLFTLIYLDLPPEICFVNEINNKILEQSEDLKSINSIIKTEVSFEPAELFAQCITSLDSYYWEQVMQKIKNDTELFETYKEMLVVIKESIEKCFYKVANNKEDIPKVGVIILLQKRIDQMNVIPD